MTRLINNNHYYNTRVYRILGQLAQLVVTQRTVINNTQLFTTFCVFSHSMASTYLFIFFALGFFAVPCVLLGTESCPSFGVMYFCFCFFFLSHKIAENSWPFSSSIWISKQHRLRDNVFLNWPVGSFHYREGHFCRWRIASLSLGTIFQSIPSAL